MLNGQLNQDQIVPAAPEAARCFLFLQGPHGAFFYKLAKHLCQAGHDTRKIGFNGGDEGEWPDRATYLAFRGASDIWPGFFRRYLENNHVTDLVLYGDYRGLHRDAIEIARAQGLTLHFFEEGYLRPHWVTYERGGVNGSSRLNRLDLGQITASVARDRPELHPAPARWGALAQHVLAGAIYHARVLVRGGQYPGYRSHRGRNVMAEFALYLRRLIELPVNGFGRRWRERRIFRSGAPYHLVLLQLSHDASVQAHSRFSSMTEFMEEVAQEFAKGAPGHHQLVFKAHPLEDGSERLDKVLRKLAQETGLERRIHFVPGGKLANLMDRANSAVTINSTAGQQALWRGIPLKAIGQAVYAKPEFVSDQSLAAFFARPMPPDSAAYRLYRHFLLITSQLPGSFYTRHGRQNLLRYAADMMLASQDPYQRLLDTVPDAGAVAGSAVAKPPQMANLGTPPARESVAFADSAGVTSR